MMPADSLTGFCLISFHLPIVLGRWRLKWKASHCFGVPHTDPGTLNNKPECAVGIPGLATGATLNGLMSQWPLVNGGNKHPDALPCFVVFAAVVLVCKGSLLGLSCLQSQRCCWLRVYISAILLFLPLKGNPCQDTAGEGICSFEWFLICSFSSHLSVQNQHGSHSAWVYTVSSLSLLEMHPWFLLA